MSKGALHVTKTKDSFILVTSLHSQTPQLDHKALNLSTNFDTKSTFFLTLVAHFRKISLIHPLKQSFQSQKRIYFIDKGAINERRNDSEKRVDQSL